MAGTLAVDHGNSRVRAARVAQGGVELLWEGPAAPPFGPRPGLPALRAYVSSVRQQDAGPLLDLLAEVTGVEPCLIPRDLAVPLESTYETPESLGSDRLLAALAAWEECPAGALVVDAGTALTVDWVDARGRFRGGAIAPGPGLLAASLKDGAAGLEWGDLDPDARWPGRTSAACCDVGLSATARGALRELLQAARLVAGSDLPLLLTGGAADRLAGLVPELEFHMRPHLVLAGIAIAARASHG